MFSLPKDIKIYILKISLQILFNVSLIYLLYSNWVYIDTIEEPITSTIVALTMIVMLLYTKFLIIYEYMQVNIFINVMSIALSNSTNKHISKTEDNKDTNA
jgi:hypothetical protein